MAIKNERELERVLKALANKRRLNILAFLSAKKEASVGQISEHLKLSFKATSKHLSVLFGAGVVDKEQRSVQVIFSLADKLPEAASKTLQLL